MSKELIKVPAKPRSKGIDPAQGVLDLGIYPQTEMRGFGMGVLSDGTPFLTQRGLARLCGVRNAHIGTISTKWNESPQKPRMRRIRAILLNSGVSLEEPHVRLKRGSRAIFAYPEPICLAVLEYYAFHAGGHCRDAARHNFRSLAGSALQNFIYTQVGYQADQASPPDLAGIASARFAACRQQARIIQL
ncbi:MAG: hypothetical protein QOD29_6442 [Alphaproteobacteria bacterium]|nr:hypothetical protein [Alphaproteobacteria bacterium]